MRCQGIRQIERTPARNVSTTAVVLIYLAHRLRSVADLAPCQSYKSTLTIHPSYQRSNLSENRTHVAHIEYTLC